MIAAEVAHAIEELIDGEIEFCKHDQEVESVWRGVSLTTIDERRFMLDDDESVMLVEVMRRA